MTTKVKRDCEHRKALETRYTPSHQPYVTDRLREFLWRQHMEDIRVLITVILIMTGFGLVVLLGAVLPRDSHEEDESERRR